MPGWIVMEPDNAIRGMFEDLSSDMIWVDPRFIGQALKDGRHMSYSLGELNRLLGKTRDKHENKILNDLLSSWGMSLKDVQDRLATKEKGQPLNMADLYALRLPDWEKRGIAIRPKHMIIEGFLRSCGSDFKRGEGIAKFLLDNPEIFVSLWRSVNEGNLMSSRIAQTVNDLSGQSVVLRLKDRMKKENKTLDAIAKEELGSDLIALIQGERQRSLESSLGGKRLATVRDAMAKDRKDFITAMRDSFPKAAPEIERGAEAAAFALIGRELAKKNVSDLTSGIKDDAAIRAVLDAGYASKAKAIYDKVAAGKPFYDAIAQELPGKVAEIKSKVLTERQKQVYESVAKRLTVDGHYLKVLPPSEIGSAAPSVYTGVEVGSLLDVLDKRAAREGDAGSAFASILRMYANNPAALTAFNALKVQASEQIYGDPKKLAALLAGIGKKFEDEVKKLRAEAKGDQAKEAGLKAKIALLETTLVANVAVQARKEGFLGPKLIESIRSLNPETQTRIVKMVDKGSDTKLGLGILPFLMSGKNEIREEVRGRLPGVLRYMLDQEGTLAKMTPDQIYNPKRYDPKTDSTTSHFGPEFIEALKAKNLWVDKLEDIKKRRRARTYKDAKSRAREEMNERKRAAMPTAAEKEIAASLRWVPARSEGAATRAKGQQVAPPKAGPAKHKEAGLDPKVSAFFSAQTELSNFIETAVGQLIDSPKDRPLIFKAYHRAMTESAAEPDKAAIAEYSKDGMKPMMKQVIIALAKRWVYATFSGTLGTAKAAEHLKVTGYTARIKGQGAQAAPELIIDRKRIPEELTIDKMEVLAAKLKDFIVKWALPLDEAEKKSTAGR
ncbi:MAG: hypothetical protein V1827_06285, partial [Candidatus Micrarchaeota archaeon]